MDRFAAPPFDLRAKNYICRHGINCKRKIFISLGGVTERGSTEQNVVGVVNT